MQKEHHRILCLSVVLLVAKGEIPTKHRMNLREWGGDSCWCQYLIPAEEIRKICHLPTIMRQLRREIEN